MSEPGVICRQCGRANPPGNNFCGQCGTFIAPRPAATMTALPDPLEPSEEEVRLRRNSLVVYAITALFVFTCIALFVVVIVWRP
jgi:uncharacterized membrane protein YvbJ